MTHSCVQVWGQDPGHQDQVWGTLEDFRGSAGLRAWAPLLPVAVHSVVPRETGNPDFHVESPCLANTETGQTELRDIGFSPWPARTQLPGEGLTGLIVHYYGVYTAEDVLSCQKLLFPWHLLLLFRSGDFRKDNVQTTAGGEALEWSQADLPGSPMGGSVPCLQELLPADREARTQAVTADCRPRQGAFRGWPSKHLKGGAYLFILFNAVQEPLEIF